MECSVKILGIHYQGRDHLSARNAKKGKAEKNAENDLTPSSASPNNELSPPSLAVAPVEIRTAFFTGS